MHRVHRSVLVPYSDAQMFDLVRDVARYPQFLPWCPSTQVQAPVERAPDTDAAADPRPAGEECVQARVDIAYLGVRSHFTTRNSNRRPSAIELALVDGPFRSLRGRWTFLALGPAACKVSLELEYGFAAGLLGRAIAPVFEHVANSLVDAFAARAQDLYGIVEP
jgi:ribosome-associated toxin RatA of RatAB toxin-antitoxin module